MDTIAHGLWAYVLSTTRRHTVSWFWIFFFAALPDLLWFPTLLIGGLSHDNWYFLRAYDVSHSLIVWLGVTLLISAFRRRWFLITWPWALHILIDMPGHKGSIGTPFLWPISDYTLPSWWDWLTLRMLLGNYIVLAIVFAFIFFKRRRRVLPNGERPTNLS